MHTAMNASILLVDDSPDTLEMYSVGLSCAGYQPVTAPDVTTALGQLKRNHPDAVVTDLLLGERDGWALIRDIKQDPATREIPVVVLTGWTDPSIAQTAVNAGCAAVLTKPCVPQELADVLQHVLARAL